MMMTKRLAVVALAAACGAAAASGGGPAAKPSPAEMVARIDAGRRPARGADVTRVGSLLAQMAVRYGTNETAVADCAVRARDLMRERCGIETKLQPLLEDLNRIDGGGDGYAGLQVSAAVYARLRDGGRSGAEAVAAINAATRPYKKKPPRNGVAGRLQQ